MANEAPTIRYQCDNPGCGVDRMSRTNLAVYGTCKECGTGTMRRKVLSCTGAPSCVCPGCYPAGWPELR